MSDFVRWSSSLWLTMRRDPAVHVCHTWYRLWSRSITSRHKFPTCSPSDSVNANMDFGLFHRQMQPVIRSWFPLNGSFNQLQAAVTVLNLWFLTLCNKQECRLRYSSRFYCPYFAFFFYFLPFLIFLKSVLFLLRLRFFLLIFIHCYFFPLSSLKYYHFALYLQFQKFLKCSPVKVDVYVELQSIINWIKMSYNRSTTDCGLRRTALTLGQKVWMAGSEW